MEKVLARFDGYRLREVSFDRDALELSRWISEDEYHQHLTPAFFLGLIEGENGYLRPDPRPNCYAMEDARGTVFFIRIDRAARVNIQFDPASPSVSARARVARALMKGMALIEVGLQRSHVSEWVFDTRSMSLKTMARARLGFAESPHDLVRMIPLPKPGKRQQEPPGGQEEPSGEVQ